MVFSSKQIRCIGMNLPCFTQEALQIRLQQHTRNKKMIALLLDFSEHLDGGIFDWYVLQNSTDCTDLSTNKLQLFSRHQSDGH